MYENSSVTGKSKYVQTHYQERPLRNSDWRLRSGVLESDGKVTLAAYE
jgi:hypothetical protein